MRSELMRSEPIVFKLLVGTNAETKKREILEVDASVTIGDAKFVGGGSGIKEAMDSLLAAVFAPPEGNVLPGHIEE
jgi:hypothetical protein